MRALRLVCECVSIGLLISFAFPGECVQVYVIVCVCEREKRVPPWIIYQYHEDSLGSSN